MMSNFTDFLATPPATSGKVSRVATGSITAGNPVQINSDGTVSIPAATLSTSVAGGAQVTTNNYQNNYPQMVYMPNIDRYFQVYIYSTNRYLYYTVGTPQTDGSITWTSPALFDNSYAPYYISVALVYHPPTGKVLVVGSNNSAYNYAWVATVTAGGTATAAGVTSLGRVDYPDTNGYIYDSTSQNIVLVGVDGASSYGVSKVISISGTTISVGSTYTFPDGLSAISVTSDPNSGKIVCLASNGVNNFAYLGTISGTSITFGSGQSLGISYSGGMRLKKQTAKYIDGAAKHIVNYYDSNNGNCYVFLLAVSGSTISVGNAVQITGDSASYRTAFAYDSSTDKIIATYMRTSDNYIETRTIAYSNSTLSSPATATVMRSSFGYHPWSVNDTSRNRIGTIIQANDFYAYTSTYGSASMTANNFLGFAESSVSNGQTLNVTVVGGVNSNQSGLTTGSKYYASGSSTSLSTSGTITAGIALSATSILTKG